MQEILISQKNNSIWEEINKEYSIDLKYHSDKPYGCYCINKSAVIFIDKNNLCEASFTHEMLHILLRSKDIFIGASLKSTFLSHYKLGVLLSEELLDHIANSLEHVKMLPLYLNCGYKREDFLLDYFYNKCDNKTLKKFNKSYRYFGRLNHSIIDPYIGTLVAMLCDPNEQLDYSLQLLNFEKLDPELFAIIYRLFNNWGSVNIESTDFISYNYRDVIGTFSNDLDLWCDNNKI